MANENEPPQPTAASPVPEPAQKLAKVDISSALRVKKLSEHAVLPTRGSQHAAGYDLSSAYEAVVPARGQALVKTDLSIAIPDGTYARVAPRSGLANKHSIDVGAGVIDADYRGPVGVILFNFSDKDFKISAGDRIAQLILERIVTPEVVQVDDLDITVRGAGGFGSTGVTNR
ncbi:dUTPase [Klebsormidium nitens]|uniref:Deoxyuridine 5'-triphosphate nucleotidohydrolase n=1 Tax=Klebsormidium nitens TaxID=105231 RepID=A0A1Y1IFT1_KLENI|nr:dUTPase [Klebsormidium nitens]|eukprot:GAQ86968.1 dUTPase [Klebsormidium nitens]